MKNFVCICLVTLCMVSCASYVPHHPDPNHYRLTRKKFRNLEPSKMDLYTLRSWNLANNNMDCYYFYVDRRNGIYMHVDDKNSVEFGLCRTSQDTLYCYPRFYKDYRDSVFVRSNISRLYAAFNDKGGLDDLDELVYLQTEDKLIYIGPPGFWPESALLIGGGDFEKVKIRNKRKYMHFLMNMP